MNKVILIGNLGAKPELKYLPSGQAVCEMRVATSETFKDKNDQKQERTEWHRIVVWGKTGENCAQYLDKGRPVAVEGRIQTRTWDDKTTGEKRYMTEIVASFVKFLGGGNGKKNEGGGGDTGGDDLGGLPPSDDDIPF
jgi:single-strand DNA-binding protein